MRVGLWLLLLVVLAGVGLLASAWTAFGQGAEGARRTRMEHSAQWHEGHFENPQPLVNDGWESFTALFNASPVTRPEVTAPEQSFSFPRLGRGHWELPPPTGLRVTWLGHSTSLVEIDGHRVLTDPMWGDRASPLGWVGPKRWFPPVVALADLPKVDAVVISHDHYDHLDMATISAMKGWDTTFVVPLGLGAHLESWGVPTSHIVELDWWGRTQVGGLEIVLTPSRHASGRTGIVYNPTLWSGFALLGSKHRLYYSGDTGLFPAMKDIGTRLGPFDVTLIEVGQYHRGWPDWHMGPEQAVRAHQWVQGRVLIPVHWGLFTLAAHGWTEPVERVRAAADQAGQTVVVPRPGQGVEPEHPPAFERWWPQLPWKTAVQDPIISTQLN